MWSWRGKLEKAENREDIHIIQVLILNYMFIGREYMKEGTPGSRYIVISNQEMIQAESRVCGWISGTETKVWEKRGYCSIAIWIRNQSIKERGRQRETGSESSLLVSLGYEIWFLSYMWKCNMLSLTSLNTYWFRVRNRLCKWARKKIGKLDFERWAKRAEVQEIASFNPWRLCESRERGN